MQHSTAKRRDSGRAQTVCWAAAFALAVAIYPAGASAASFTGDGWKVDLSGYANAFYTTASCPDGNAVGGSALADMALGCAGQENRTTIGNGLLPNALITKFSTTQEGIDVNAQISIMESIATSDALSANSGLDVRQAYFTVGTPDFGTFKLGRDYGIFGSNAILSDMTLLGVGAPVQATQRGRVTLGHIGAGYTYLGSYGQIVYTTPGTSGLSFTGGVFSPVDSGAYASRSDPHIQAQISYSSGAFKFWIGAKQQKFYPASASGAASSSFDLHAEEIGLKFTAGLFSLLANVQAGRGIGILTDADQGDVKGINYLLQGTWQVSPKFKLGLSGGESRNRDDSAAAGHFRYNTNITGGGYYSLTKSVTLVVELSWTRSEDYLGNSAGMNGIALGGIMFF
jgi:predicted porin